MPRTRSHAARPLVAGLLGLLFALALASSASATCYGTYYEYYDTPALQNIVGAMVSCPGYPDQHDEDVNGNYVVTPWYITQPIVCACPPSGGGGGGGGGNPNEEDGGG